VNQSRLGKDDLGHTAEDEWGGLALERVVDLLRGVQAGNAGL
jgi:hypothetical protein